MLLFLIQNLFIFLIGIFLGSFLYFINNSSLLSFQKDSSDIRRKEYYGKGYLIPSNIKREQKWEPNSRGYLLHQQVLLPKEKNIKGIILICHGFGDHSLDFLIEIALKFVNSSYAVITLDAEVNLLLLLFYLLLIFFFLLLSSSSS